MRMQGIYRMKNENIKVLEIRDRSTLIPAFAIKMLPFDAMELFLFRCSGYSGFNHPCIILLSLQAPWHAAKHSDEWCERSPRTMSTAHKYIEKHFDQLKPGDVIDVEFILGEKDKPSINGFIEEGSTILSEMRKENS